LASSAAPIITDGLDVFVHDVIAAIVTAPWSRVNFVPSSRVTSTGSLVRPPSRGAAERWLLGGADSPCPLDVAGSDAGNVSATDSS